MKEMSNLPTHKICNNSNNTPATQNVDVLKYEKHVKFSNTLNLIDTVFWKKKNHNFITPATQNFEFIKNEKCV